MYKNESREDYLERILILKEKNDIVRSIDIANSMGFSKPSVSIALKKLKESGLIEISVNNNVSLTKEGLEIAEKVYERHKTISYLLTSIGVPEDIALEDACKIEHDLSEITFEKIKEQYNKIKK